MDRSQAVAEPPLAHSSTFLPHHDDTPGTHASSAKTASATSRQDLHKALAAVQDHVQHMRKYMKVWVKREQWLRMKSATCIQKFYRGHLARVKFPRPAVPTKSAPAMATWPMHMSSYQIMWESLPQNTQIFHIYAQIIQKIVRGSYTRRRLVEWKRANYSARQIQRVWRGYVVRGNLVGKGGATLLHQVRCVLIRVGKLERQAGIQDEATMALWSQLKQVTTDSHNHHRLTRAVSRLQAAWKGKLARRQHGQSSRKSTEWCEAPCKQCQANALEIATLRQELHDLAALVRQLTVPPETSGPHPNVDPSPRMVPSACAALPSLPTSHADMTQPLTLADFFVRPNYAPMRDMEVQYHSLDDFQAHVATSSSYLDVDLLAVD
ncbi:hypothetical protein H257_13097 [Aphanomyces astaci]|uniref:Uncharacterized protein n=1 Tax=Aphanomyces astaci TaxID=112090 RepID=W4FVY6_APHAT|nr:hypothetical protein H257_13097 [Aphanomyces astaci]ETV71642.1 hypothetical protein H257_13097 [Aphanomyces astaci]|eukprot:XP_009838830.1 hypothetical protein H257_13097 [Aphanomyces astaci]